MGLGVGLGTGLGGDGAASAAPAAPNPNLLVWSEEMQQAAWTASGATVTADAGLDPLGGLTADLVVFGSGGTSISQAAFAATTGATVVLDFSPIASWDTRYSLTGTFDGAVYVLSVQVNQPVPGGDLRLQMHLVGGFLVVSLRNTGDDPSVLVWGWKLETPGLTAYVKREGT